MDHTKVSLNGNAVSGVSVMFLDSHHLCNIFAVFFFFTCCVWMFAFLWQQFLESVQLLESGLDINCGDILRNFYIEYTSPTWIPRGTHVAGEDSMWKFHSVPAKLL